MGSIKASFLKGSYYGGQHCILTMCEGASSEILVTRRQGNWIARSASIHCSRHSGPLI